MLNYWDQQASGAAGQQESKVESLESIHAARLRSGSEAGTSAPQVGQAQPPAALTAKSQSASDSDPEDEIAFGNGGLGEPDTETDPYLLPVSHEVALEGVCLSDGYANLFYCMLWALFGMHSTRCMSDCCMTVTTHVHLFHLCSSHARPAIFLQPTSPSLLGHSSASSPTAQCTNCNPYCQSRGCLCLA